MTTTEHFDKHVEDKPMIEWLLEAIETRNKPLLKVCGRRLLSFATTSIV
jgi:GTP:adenosylcobinamide-phosphate guanylyltransferase